MPNPSSVQSMPWPQPVQAVAAALTELITTDSADPDVILSFCGYLYLAGRAAGRLRRELSGSTELTEVRTGATDPDDDPDKDLDKISQNS